jgi:hypothetical protein
MFFKVFGLVWDMEPTNLDLGMKLLHSIKELGLNISRTSLDFLLSACAKAKNLRYAQKIWMEYEYSGLPHNVLTSLRLSLSSLSCTLRQDFLKHLFHHVMCLFIFPLKEQLMLLLGNSI